MSSSANDRSARLSAPAEPGSDARDPAAVWLPLTELTPWKRNPRKNSEAVDAIARSIIEFGWGAPIIAREQDLRVVAGDTRRKAALRLRTLWDRASADDRKGWHPEAVRTLETGLVPVRCKPMTDQQANALAIADNKLGELASWENAGLAAIMSELDDEGVDPALLGFTEAEFEKLTGQNYQAEVTPIDVSEARPEFWLQATGPLGKQPDFLAKLKAALAGVDGVTVQITVAE